MAQQPPAPPSERHVAYQALRLGSAAVEFRERALLLWLTSERSDPLPEHLAGIVETLTLAAQQIRGEPGGERTLGAAAQEVQSSAAACLRLLRQHWHGPARRRLVDAQEDQDVWFNADEAARAEPFRADEWVNLANAVRCIQEELPREVGRWAELGSCLSAVRYAPEERARACPEYARMDNLLSQMSGHPFLGGLPLQFTSDRYHEHLAPGHGSPPGDRPESRAEEPRGAHLRGLGYVPSFDYWTIQEVDRLHQQLESRLSREGDAGDGSDSCGGALPSTTPADETGLWKIFAELGPDVLAVILRAHFPEWSVRRIAETVGVNRTALYRIELFRRVQALTRSEKRGRPRGHVNRDEASGGHGIDGVWNDRRRGDDDEE
jgi:hypothetical protein